MKKAKRSWILDAHFPLVAFDVLAIAEPVIEEVRGSAQLEKILADKDFVAVLWNARNCRYVCDQSHYTLLRSGSEWPFDQA